MPPVLAGVCALVSAFGFARLANGQDPDAAANAMIAKYAGTWEVGAFLEEQAVRGELQELMGAELKTLEHNLNVNGGVEFISGALAVRGNAPHKGTEEEAIVCVQPFGAAPKVHAAVFSQGFVTVYTRETRYDFMTVCVKDWITLVSSRHINRLEQPENVRMAAPR